MEQWRRILEKTMQFGELRQDRTGVGTYALFGEQLVFDNHTTFPAVTLKKLGFEQVKAELACFLQGYDNLEDFHKMGCTIWDGNGNSPYWLPFARFEGDLGRIYGNMWRKWPVPQVREQPRPKLREGIALTFLNIANGSGSASHPLGKTWQGMMARCYNLNSRNYSYYGARGVFVHNRWLEFEAFAEDAVKLPGWSEAILAADSHAYQLDKDTRGDGFRYGPEHCAWVSAEDNHPKKDCTKYTVEREDGEVFSFTNPHQFCAEQAIDGKNFCDLWTGRKNAKSRYGFKLLDVQTIKHAQYVDQLVNLVEGLSKEPHGRRHIVTAWNPGELSQMCLPPCHMFFQAFIGDNQRLDLAVYMRSVDLFLGLPFDIASYALLQRLLAQSLGLNSGFLTFFLGDTHIYLNHQDQVREVLEREEIKGPKLELDAAATIFNFKPEQAKLVNYISHAAVSAPLNV
jgi:thymidylate synthase